MESVSALPPFGKGLLAGTAVIWVVLELRQGLRRRPEAVQASLVSELLFRVALVCGGVAALLISQRAVVATIAPPAAAAWIGLLLLWCGMALRLWSFRTLGRYFTMVVQTSGDQPVIASGPYRFVRHPSYTGFLLAIIGVGLFITNWLSLIILTAACVCGLLLRIRVEERALTRDLGDAYRSYAAAHKRLLPFIW